MNFNYRLIHALLQVVAPLIVKCFSDCGKTSTPSFPYAEEQDRDLAEAWLNSLKEEMLQDRQSLARFLNSKKFAHGYVELKEECAELILRAITELRLYIRKSCLDSFLDSELETGAFSLGQKPKDAQSFYLAYLVLAEVQEGIIARMT